VIAIDRPYLYLQYSTKYRSSGITRHAIYFETTHDFPDVAFPRKRDHMQKSCFQEGKMKRQFNWLGMVALVFLALTLQGCDTGNDPRVPAENVRASTLSLGRASMDASSDNARLSASTLANGDRVFFRSSDIEFWHIDTVADIESIVSAKHRAGSVDYSQNHSLEYALGDAVESIVFMSSQDVIVGINRTDLNTDWEQNVAAFVAAGKTTINAIRLDIGSGMVVFEIAGETPEVYTADMGATNGINGNSIFFVDRAFLNRPILITRAMEEQMLQESAAADSLGLGLTASECALVEAIHYSSSVYDTETPIDLNGALIVPMDPVELIGFDPATEALDIVITWDMAEAVGVQDGYYVMEDRVGLTCFDFDVSVRRSAK